MNYLIGLDLDGTLLSNNKEISNYNKDIIKKITNLGHSVFLVTGRSYDGAIKYYNELGLKTPLITLNGALTTYNDKETSIYFKEDFIELYKRVDKYIVSGLLNSNDKIYVKNHDSELEKIFNGSLSNKEYLNIDLNKKYNDILNGVFVVNESDMSDFEKDFTHDLYKARYWGTWNNLSFYDIHMKGVSKASAIKTMLNELNIDNSKLITLGDGVNDLEMLQMTAHGTAMKNASIDVKMFANNTTDHDNDNDGVGRHLNNLLLK